MKTNGVLSVQAGARVHRDGTWTARVRAPAGYAVVSLLMPEERARTFASALVDAKSDHHTAIRLAPGEFARLDIEAELIASAAVLGNALALASDREGAQ